MQSARRRATTAVNVWPGYVDALSALLMLVIFMLLIFTVAQVFLAQTVSSRDAELDELNQQLAEISNALNMQQASNKNLTQQLSILQNKYQQGEFYQDALKTQIVELEALVDSDKETITTQLGELAQLQHDIVALRQVRIELESNIANMLVNIDNKDKTIEAFEVNRDQQLALMGELRDNTKSLKAMLATQKDYTLLAQEEISKKELRIEDLVVVVQEGKEALEDQKQLSLQAYANVKQLGNQLEELKAQLTNISQALHLEEQKNAGKEVQLVDLGKRLNTLLAERVNELEQYRSEFFGQLRKVLVENPDIRIEGDRFLLPSELFFASGSATLGQQGKQELKKLAKTLSNISTSIPDKIHWIMRIDGHTDQVPINTAQFPSNWELSTARAVSVVRFLVAQGIAPKRMTAAGFGEFHPIDTAKTVEANQRNRRIELKLTER